MSGENISHFSPGRTGMMNETRMKEHQSDLLFWTTQDMRTGQVSLLVDLGVLYHQQTKSTRPITLLIYHQQQWVGILTIVCVYPHYRGPGLVTHKKAIQWLMALGPWSKLVPGISEGWQIWSPRLNHREWLTPKVYTTDLLLEIAIACNSSSDPHVRAISQRIVMRIQYKKFPLPMPALAPVMWPAP